MTKKTTPPQSSASDTLPATGSKAERLRKRLTDELLQLMDDGEATIVEKEGNLIRRLRPTKVGQARGKSVTIEELNNFLQSNDFLEERTKRIYRRKEDYPDPSKPSWAEVNRSPRKKTQINLRLPPDVLDVVDAAAERTGLNRTVWMTSAFLRAARDQGVDLSDELDAMIQEPDQDGPS